MTIVFTGVLPRQLIVMTVDSAVTNYLEDRREYVTGRKAYGFPGVGCVTTWGARNQNRIGEFLAKQSISPATHSVHKLADLVYYYLTTEYRPRELDLEDVGYHVAGFDQNRQACFPHIFWGIDRPGIDEPKVQEYRRYEEPLYNQKNSLFYSGRNDLTEVVVRTLLRQVVRDDETRYRLALPVELACFSDFVARFAAELTPEVGPPFLTYLITPNNQMKQVKNDSFCPIGGDNIAKELIALGYPNPTYKTQSRS